MVPLTTAYGIFVTPWIAAIEEWREGGYGIAIFCIVFAGWPMWTIILIIVLSSSS